MSDRQLRVSVIIPSHNRSRSLRRTLDALRTQTFPLDQVEVIVVADDCVDDTAAMVRSYPAPFALRVLEERLRSAGEARNCGARFAQGELLLFVDDDVEPTPRLIEAHVRAHVGQPERAAVGPYPPLPQAHAGLFRLRIRDWWQQKFQDMSIPGHRFTYQDLLTGNFSLHSELFRRLGGFDTAFRAAGGEDYEFGLRLLKAEIPLVFVPEALGYHHEHETMSLEGAFRRAYNEGRTDVLMGERHPEIRPLQNIFLTKQHRSRAQRVRETLIFRLPKLADRVVGFLKDRLSILERVGLREHWGKLFGHLRAYWYWRGVIDELGTRESLARYMREAYATVVREPELTFYVDLRAGLAEAERLLDVERPHGTQVYYGDHLICVLPAMAGQERLRGEHLRPFLARWAGPALLRALALDGVIEEGTPPHRHKLAQRISRSARWYGPAYPRQMWWEQYSQWEEFRQLMATEKRRRTDVQQALDTAAAN